MTSVTYCPLWTGECPLWEEQATLVKESLDSFLLPPLVDITLDYFHLISHPWTVVDSVATHQFELTDGKDSSLGVEILQRLEMLLEPSVWKGTEAAPQLMFSWDTSVRNARLFFCLNDSEAISWIHIVIIQCLGLSPLPFCRLYALPLLSNRLTWLEQEQKIESALQSFTSIAVACGQRSIFRAFITYALVPSEMWFSLTSKQRWEDFLSKHLIDFSITYFLADRETSEAKCWEVSPDVVELWLTSYECDTEGEISVDQACTTQQKLFFLVQQEYKRLEKFLQGKKAAKV
jgi:hypothetical protein